jgi:hypothetical protein
MMQKVMKRDDGNIIFVGQHCMKFVQRCVGMIRNELANFVFVRGEFTFRTGLVLFRSDTARLAALLEEGVIPRAAHFIVENEVFDGNTAIVIFYHTFS